MRKRFKAHKKMKIRKIVYMFLIVFLVFIFRCYIAKIKLINSNEKLINIFLDNSNYYSYNNDKNIIEDIYSYINKNVFNTPISILESEFKYKKPNNVEPILLTYKENQKPKVYIYNSHQGENYSYEYLEQYNIVPNVLMASSMLKEKLEGNNISTIVEESDILEYMDRNNFNHADSYIASRHFLESTINKYDSIDLFIDLHRDAATHEVTHTTINGKDCAKILFVIGLEYSTYDQNLSVVTQINNIILNKYPTLTRGIMKKEGYGVNGVYNQDLSPNVILIEIGGNENNIEEVNNTLDIIASVIGEYLNEKK